MITSPDGGLYSFPFYYSDPTDPQCYAYWINKDRLDKLGLEMPTTPDELFDVLVAFRDGDPNGNGIPDEGFVQIVCVHRAYHDIHQESWRMLCVGFSYAKCR
jgi:ABC-type glycerol-3-phosphate transport system substrate-binding protein